MCVFVKKVSKSKTKLEGKLEGVREGVRTIATRHAACVGRGGRAHEFVCGGEEGACASARVVSLEAREGPWGREGSAVE